MGPLASSMADLELAYHILATPDPSNPISSIFAPPHNPASKMPRKKIIGICKPWFSAADAPVLTACEAALKHYTSLGYETIDIHLPYLHEAN